MDKFKKFLLSDSMMKVYAGLLCVFAGLFIGLIAFIIVEPAYAFEEFPKLIVGGFKLIKIKYLGQILAYSAPLIMCGLCILFAYNTGVFNIGIAGQYTMGAFACFLFGLYLKLPWYVTILLAAVFGAIWAAIPAMLNVFFKVNVVISGIMLNWIALFFTNYSLTTYLRSCINTSLGGKTNQFMGNSKLPQVMVEKMGTQFTIAFFIALLFALAIFVIMTKTKLGYKLKASGLNKDATKYAGMNEKKNIIVTMAIAGALAGIGAALYYLANLTSWEAFSSTSTPGMAWNGIVVAFVAQLSPIGSIFVSLFITMISRGGSWITQMLFPKEMSDVITGIIIYSTGLVAILRLFIMRFIEKKKKDKELSLMANNDNVVNEEVPQEVVTSKEGGNE